MTKPNIPKKIELSTDQSTLTLIYGNEHTYDLTSEFLRVLSPSAEVRGHGQGNEILQTGKKNVKITHIEPVGNYAIKITFSDQHDSGLYSWSYLQMLCETKESQWKNYLLKLSEAGQSREPAN